MLGGPQEKYYEGRKNQIIRYYYYLNTGLQLVNEWKYIGAFIFALYYTLKLTNPVFLAVMLIIIAPILAVMGWVKVNHIAKVTDWLTVELGTYWSRRGYELQEDIIKTLKEIRDKK